MAHQGYQTDKYGHISAEDFVERIRDAILGHEGDEHDIIDAFNKFNIVFVEA